MTYKKVLGIVFLVIFSIALSGQVALAQDWNQWRGANRDGVIHGFTAPNSLPEKLNLKWKIEVGGGHASPVVSGKRVFLHSRQGEQEVVASFDLETGKQLWKDSYPVNYTMNPAAIPHGKGPKSTPVIAGSNLYTLGINGVLSCYEATAGKLKWRKEFSKEFKPTSPDFGVA